MNNSNSIKRQGFLEPVIFLYLIFLLPFQINGQVITEVDYGIQIDVMAEASSDNIVVKTSEDSLAIKLLSEILAGEKTKPLPVSPVWSSASIHEPPAVYYKHGGRVYLRGLVRNLSTDPGDGLLATLPVGYRPVKRILSYGYITILEIPDFADHNLKSNLPNGDVHMPVRIDIETDGDVVLLTSIPTNMNEAVVQLNDISFSIRHLLEDSPQAPIHLQVEGEVQLNPLSQTDDETQLLVRTQDGVLAERDIATYPDLSFPFLLPFNAGWGNYNSGYETGYYQKYADKVHLGGLVQRISTAGTFKIATLPAGFRPAARIISSGMQNGQTYRIDIFPNGDVEAINGIGSSFQYISLNGISFRAAN